VLGITKRRIGAAAVTDYFNRIPNPLMIHNGRRGFRGAIMKSSVVKRSIAIDGHRTSVSLEDPFWTDLKKIAHTQQMALSELVTKIDSTREQGNLSSAIRLFVLHHFRNEDRRTDVAKARLPTVGAERTPASQP
jgi:predicted DNA-binding ribbon-helix-helix protein